MCEISNELTVFEEHYSQKQLFIGLDITIWLSETNGEQFLCRKCSAGYEPMLCRRQTLGNCQGPSSATRYLSKLLSIIVICIAT
jgi:hypothetical protein